MPAKKCPKSQTRDLRTKRCRKKKSPGIKKSKSAYKKSPKRKSKVRHPPHSYYAKHYPKSAARINRKYKRKSPAKSKPRLSPTKSKLRHTPNSYYAKHYPKSAARINKRKSPKKSTYDIKKQLQDEVASRAAQKSAAVHNKP